MQLDPDHLRQPPFWNKVNVGHQPITSSHFEEQPKKLCEKVPLLRDERPPLWCDVLEFHYWVNLEF